MTVTEVIELIVQNMPMSVTLAVIGILSLIQIVPIKLNPWSALARCIGRAVNREMLDKIDGIESEVKSLKSTYDEREANHCRTRILRFSDEIYLGIKHSKEHFDQILIDITAYEAYCREHDNYKNNVAVLAIANINDVYKECQKNHTFL